MLLFMLSRGWKLAFEQETDGNDYLESVHSMIHVAECRSTIFAHTFFTRGPGAPGSINNQHFIFLPNRILLGEHTFLGLSLDPSGVLPGWIFRRGYPLYSSSCWRC